MEVAIVLAVLKSRLGADTAKFTNVGIARFG